MPPDKIAFFSSDEEEHWRPLCSSAIVNRRRRVSDSEIDELESDAEDELVPAPAFVIRTRAQRAEIEETKRRKREAAKEEKRKRRKKEKKAAQAAAKQKKALKPETTTVPAPVPPTSSSTSTQRRSSPKRSLAPIVVDSTDDSDVPLPSLLVRSSQQKRSEAPSAQPERMSEDEVELIASQSSPQPPAAAASQERSSSLPILAESSQHGTPSQRAASANPQGNNEPSSAVAPIQLDPSDAPIQSDLTAGAGDLDSSDLSSDDHYTDTEGYEPEEWFYTSSEGTLHGSDDEEGLGSWTERDQEQWQGSTAHLDDAYHPNYLVKTVLRHRQNPRRGHLEYRTVWLGYPPYVNTWEPEKHFNDPITLEDYWNRQGGRPADAIEDTFSHSAHSSDTDVAVNHRPRRRAHEAMKKKRRDIRRDKVQIKQYLQSLNEAKREEEAQKEAKMEEKRRRKKLSLSTMRRQEKGSSRGHQKRMERMAQKNWQRYGGSGARPSRFNATRDNRNMADISMKARAGPALGSMAARLRVSQLNDSIPEDDENQMVFRRPASSNNGPGPSFASIRESTHPGYGAPRPASGPSMSSVAGPSTTTTNRAPAPRPPPGSYKGAHRREPKVQMQPDFGNFLNRLHGATRTANTSAAPQPLQAPTDSNGRPIETGRRTSEIRKSSLLVLKPVEDFQGGSRPAPAAPRTQEDSAASSDAADTDAFGIPEMSALRSQFNPRQPAPEGDEQATRVRQPPVSSATQNAPAKHVVFAQPRPPQSMAARNRVEDPRRRPGTASGGGAQEGSPASWSPHHDDGLWSPQDSGYAGWDTASNGGRSPIPPSPATRSPSEVGSNGRGHDGSHAKVPQRLIWNGWSEFTVARNHIDTEAALFATESLSADRIQALGLASPGGTLCFDMFMPFAWIRDMLAGSSAKTGEVMLLQAHGPGAPQARSSLDQLSEQLRSLDVALLAYAGEAAVTGEAAGLKDYFVAFSSKYTVDFIEGLPPSLGDVAGLHYTVCVIPLQLEHHPAPSSRMSFEEPPRLESTVSNAIEAAIGRKTNDNLNFGRTEARKLTLAARRYRISAQLYHDIKSKYNVIFIGAHSQSYEKNVLWKLVRIFEGGARLDLNPDKDAKLWKDPGLGTNIFVRRAAFEEMFSSDLADAKAFSLTPYLRRFKRHPRCSFFTYGFSAVDPDERVREIFPGRSGLVTFSVSAILSDLLRSSIVKQDAEDPEEEGQLTQQTDKTPPESILCNAAFHLADNWRVRIHPWVRTCFKLLADDLEPVCRALHLIAEDQEFPIELMLELDSKLETLYTSALCEEWHVDEISGLPFEEPNEVPDEPEALVKRIDDEVLATLRKAQMSTAYDTRFHVMVAPNEEVSEEQLAGIEMVSLNEFGRDKCQELATLPGN